MGLRVKKDRKAQQVIQGLQDQQEALEIKGKRVRLVRQDLQVIQDPLDLQEVQAVMVMMCLMEAKGKRVKLVPLEVQEIRVRNDKQDQLEEQDPLVQQVQLEALEQV